MSPSVGQRKIASIPGATIDDQKKIGWNESRKGVCKYEIGTSYATKS